MTRTLKTLRTSTARAVLAAMLCVSVTTVLAEPPRLSGTLVGTDGRPAVGYRVLMLDDSGRPVASAMTGDRGAYAFDDLEPGLYDMGLETPAGASAYVDAPPIRVAEGGGARRDVKLRSVDPLAMKKDVQSSNYGAGHWWSQLSPAMKAWTILGGLVVLGVTAAALDSDETPASPI